MGKEGKEMVKVKWKRNKEKRGEKWGSRASHAVWEGGISTCVYVQSPLTQIH